MNSFFRKLTWLPRRRRKEADLEDELRFHLEEEIEERQARGFADTAARAGARRELGNVTLLKEDTRAAWSWTLWDQFTQDVALCVSLHAAEQGLHCAGDPVVGARHRRQYGHLQLYGRDPAAFAASARSGIASRADVAPPEGNPPRHGPAQLQREFRR